VKYTILGSSGFVGSHVAAAAKKLGYECFLPEKGHQFSSTASLGHVIYCIGLTSDFRQRPMDTIKAHVVELMRVLENSSYDSFLYLSSTRVYSGAAGGLEESQLTVNPNNPSDLYNLSKLMGESVCLSIANEKVRVARLSNVIGHDYSSENFLFSLIKEAINKKEIFLGVPMSAKKDYVAIEDVVTALLAISSRGSSRIYNVARGKSVANEVLVEKIMALTGCTLKLREGSGFLKFPEISISKLRKEFGFQPRDIVESLPELVKLAQLKIKTEL